MMLVDDQALNRRSTLLLLSMPQNGRVLFFGHPLTNRGKFVVNQLLLYLLRGIYSKLGFNITLLSLR